MGALNEALMRDFGFINNNSVSFGFVSVNTIYLATKY
jgi:hypothetical protein